MTWGLILGAIAAVIVLDLFAIILLHRAFRGPVFHRAQQHRRDAVTKAPVADRVEGQSHGEPR